MWRIKWLTFMMWVVVGSSCIKPYEPVIEANDETKYVVTGRITDAEGFQEVHISLSSPVSAPVQRPVTGCYVSITDQNGKRFDFAESEDGVYRVWMEAADLKAGNAYSLSITTPDGKQLQSGTDTLTACPPIDSVYYYIEKLPTAVPGMVDKGARFCIDLNATGSKSRFFKWEVTETWEYHAAHPVEYFYDGGFNAVIPPDFSNKICWLTNEVKNVFTLSTSSLTENTYRQFPLHFVNGQTSRLGICYSILVKQFSISEAAFEYWEKVRINNQEQGGLYEKQPLAIKGNITNLTDPGNEVLGFFYAAAFSEKRMFFNGIPDLELSFSDFCYEDVLGRMGWQEYTPQDYPVYYYFNDQGALRILSRDCVDCRTQGGTNSKPDFWPY